MEVEWTEKEEQVISLPVKHLGNFRYEVEIPERYDDCKETLMLIDYMGDIGNAFVDGELISDNFCNGSVWEIGLKNAWDPGKGNRITFVVNPVKENVRIDVSSVMAGRMEKTEGRKAVIENVRVRPVYEAVFRIEK